MTREAVDAVGGLGEVAQQLGVTTDALQEFRYVAGQTGIEEGEMDKALQRLTRTLGEIQQGAKGPNEALKQLGLTAKNLKGLDASQALVVLSDAFNKLPDAAARSAVGFDLMGRSFQTLLPLLAEGSQNIQQMVKDAHEAGIILTEDEIARADKASDALTAIEKKSDARLQSLLAANAESLVKFNTAWEETKVGFISFAVELDNVAQHAKNMASVFGTIAVRDLTAFRDSVASIGTSVVNWVGNMVAGISGWVNGKLNAVWDGVLARINVVKQAFFNLYDAVVGHSYVPDMVDGIATEMARLDAVMVKPVTAATTKSELAFRNMAESTRNLLDSLFPEIGKASQFNKDLKEIEALKLSDGEEDAAVSRLWNRYSSGSPFGSGGPGKPSWTDEQGPLASGMSDLDDALERLTDRTMVHTVKIAKSFADMADASLQSLGRLTSAIKGGGFLDILEGVIGLGLQLGSSGLFGKDFAAKLNKVPGFANGTSFAPGGLAIVGERGPELVDLPRGSRVYPNGTGPGRGNITVNINAQDAVLTSTVRQWVAEGVVIATEGGARGGVALMNHRASRRL
ncbi:MAG: hypothetical protein J7493_17105 [Porphyrobacter sp.]|nr:hypothetical protein [Porphyrobacter sp.]